jgi:hypothetical protein
VKWRHSSPDLEGPEVRREISLGVACAFAASAVLAQTSGPIDL